jgi:Ohr subfamily peroxiredoxin
VLKYQIGLSKAVPQGEKTFDLNARRMNVLYTARVTATGGRDGAVRSDDGILDLQLAYPPGLGGPGGKSNPEQLFAAGYAACFLNAVKRIAGEQKVGIGKAAATAEVGIGQLESGRFALEVTLLVELPVTPAETAKMLVEAAHEICPYSNATRGNIGVHIKLKVGDGAELALA